MKYFTPEIVYHNLEPIYTLDIQPKTKDFIRIVTGGFDCVVRIWKLETNMNNIHNSVPVDLVANLSRHTKRVNVVRWAPNGETFASASDDGTILIWTKNNNVAEKSMMDTDDDEFVNLESWTNTCLRRHIEDVYDISWSSSGNQIISGSVDCSAILWNLKHLNKSIMLKDHKQFVQGVAWDPMDNFVITQSNDRTFRVYRSKSKQCLYKVWRAGDSKLFFDGSWKYFFRRPEFSPDGRLLITPAGICRRSTEAATSVQLDESELNLADSLPQQQQHAAHIFVRHNLSKVAVSIPTGNFPVLGVRFNPVRYVLRFDPNSAVFKLPYRWVFALIIETGVLIFDTEQEMPIAKISNIHCLSITDASWSPDGHILAVSSTDGYCTYLYFGENELGVPFNLDQRQALKSLENTQEEESTDVSRKSSERIPLLSENDVRLQTLHDQSTELLPPSRDTFKKPIDEEIKENCENEDDDDDEEDDDEDNTMEITDDALDTSLIKDDEKINESIEVKSNEKENNLNVENHKIECKPIIEENNVNNNENKMEVIVLSDDSLDKDKNVESKVKNNLITNYFTPPPKKSSNLKPQKSLSISNLDEIDLVDKINRANSIRAKRRVTTTLISNIPEEVKKGEDETDVKKRKISEI